MTARVLDGTAVAQQVYAELRQRVTDLSRVGVRPGLAAVLVGDHPASVIYVRNKARACDRIGVYSEVHRLGGNCAQAALLETLDGLNRNPAIHGILVQLPLPASFDAVRVMQSVAVEKDVDGFTWKNLGALITGTQLFSPCTPLGILKLLEHTAVAIEGRHAVVVGRSAIVGRPLALMLIAAGATVTVCNSKTRDLGAFTALADILVAAAGQPGLIRGSMVKPGSVAIDVGISRLPDGRLAGDFVFQEVMEQAAFITPVPGGVGPMTVAMLIANTVLAAERAAARRA